MDILLAALIQTCAAVYSPDTSYSEQARAVSTSKCIKRVAECFESKKTSSSFVIAAECSTRIREGKSQ